MHVYGFSLMRNKPSFIGSLTAMRILYFLSYIISIDDKMYILII